MDVATAATAPSPVFLPRQRRWVVGCDLGQTADPTAISVLEHVKGVLDFNTELERHTGTGGIPQKPSVQINVRFLERLKLGMSYPAMVQHVKDLLARPPLCGDDNTKPAELVIDQTGVGRAVGDIFNSAGMAPIKITITAGGEVTWIERNSWHVAKTVLISTVDAMLHTGELRFAASLTEADAMKDELKDFRRKLSDAGRATYQARTGQHDDLVLSVAIAAWWAAQPPPAQASFGIWATVREN